MNTVYINVVLDFQAGKLHAKVQNTWVSEDTMKTFSSECTMNIVITENCIAGVAGYQKWYVPSS